MSDRKQTPDVLADILGAGPAASPPGPTQTRTPRTSSPRRSAPASAPASASAAGKAHRWEYLVVSCQHHHGWRPRYEGGVEIAGWLTGPLLHTYLEGRGREGWELVTATAGKPMFGVTDCYQLFFKRQAD
jgi:hypothetical protein